MTRGQDSEGAVPANTTIIFAVGGWDRKSQRNITLWRPGMNTVSIQTPGLGLKARRQQKRWRYRWHFFGLKILLLKLGTRLPTGSNLGQMALTWIWRLELGINRSVRWILNILTLSSFQLSSLFLLSDFLDSFLCSGSWREHVLLHWKTSQLFSWLHHYPANLWLSSGGLNEFFLPS